MKYKKGDSPDGNDTPGDIEIIGNKVRLREKKLSDAHNDYIWQSDPELVRLDAAPELSVSFSFYLLDYTDQLNARSSKRLPFAIETFDGRHIGNCTFYDIDRNKGEAQLGIMIGNRDYWDKGYGADAIVTMVSYIFLNTCLSRIYLKTLDWNLRAQRCFKNCGFVPYGRLHRNGNDFILMELRRKQWQKQHDLRDED